MYSEQHAESFVASFVELLADKVEVAASFRKSLGEDNHPIRPIAGDWTKDGAST